VSFDKDSLYAETVGEIETEGKVLVVKRIKQRFHLTADQEEDREKVERVLKDYAPSCPVARSVWGCIEITSELNLTTK
jgi:organic hydroperoxide reductase OsmC/OhrA